MPRLEVRAPVGSEDEEPCVECGDMELPKIVLKAYLTYALCPPCALELAQGFLREVRALRLVSADAS